MTQIPDNIASKIISAYKLMNESTNSNEAAVASAKVQKLLQEYNITIDSLISKDENNKVIEQILPMGSVNKDTFLGRLANILGKNNFVRVIWTYTNIRSGDIVLGQSPALSFIGLPKNVDEVVKLFQSLSYRLRFMADEDFNLYQMESLKVGIKPKHGKGWKADYLIGALDSINQRLTEQFEDFKNQEYIRQNGTVKTGNELVLVRGAEVEEYLDKNYPNLTRGKVIRKRLDYSAYQTGVERGKNINIHQNQIASGK